MLFVLSLLTEIKSQVLAFFSQVLLHIDQFQFLVKFFQNLHSQAKLVTHFTRSPYYTSTLQTLCYLCCPNISNKVYLLETVQQYNNVILIAIHKTTNKGFLFISTSCRKINNINNRCYKGASRENLYNGLHTLCE